MTNSQIYLHNGLIHIPAALCVCVTVCKTVKSVFPYVHVGVYISCSSLFSHCVCVYVHVCLRKHVCVQLLRGILVCLQP